MNQENVETKSPLGVIKALSYVNKNLKMITELNKRIEIQGYDVNTDSFEILQTIEFTDIENSCIERHYAFIEAQFANTLYLLSCEKENGDYTVYFVEFTVPKPRHTELITHKNLISIQTNNKLAALLQFKKKIHYADYEDGSVYQFNTSMFESEVSYVNFWDDNSFLVLTKTHAYIVDLETKDIIQKVETPCDTIIANGYFQNRNIWMVTSGNETDEKSKIWTNKEGTLDFHEIPFSTRLNQYFFNITKIWNDMKSDYLYTWDNKRMTILKPDSDGDLQSYSSEMEMRFPETCTTIRFIPAFSKENYGIFVAYNQNILTTWTYTDVNVRVLNISPKVETAATNSYGRHIVLKHYNHKDIVRVNEDSRIDFTIDERLTGEFVDSFEIKDTNKLDRVTKFLLFTLNFDGETINAKQLTITRGNYWYTWCDEFKTFPKTPYGKQKHLIHYNYQTDIFMVCNSQNCVEMDSKCTKDSKKTYIFCLIL